MRSHEVLKHAAERVGVKALAATLKLSPALVYKWCQEFDPGDPDAGGTRNPLDRLSDIVQSTGDVGVICWLCHEAGGYYVRHPEISPEDKGRELMMRTHQMVQEFSRLLSAVTKSVEDDGQIIPDEADRIRVAWELLKSTVETFTVACEHGAFCQRRSEPG